MRRDLLGEEPGPASELWALRGPQHLLRKQQPDGSWRYPGGDPDTAPGSNYALLETYRSLGVLVEMHGFYRAHPGLDAAADYILSCQTAEGDFRGILGNQHMPYYHGAILELLVKAGYADAPQVIRGLEWLLSVRQADGGWIVPMQAVPSRERSREIWAGPAVPPDRARPFSHLATGMVLRAFPAHPAYARHPDAMAAPSLWS